MKAYMFNTENGLYEGETFEEADMLAYEEGITTIAPPRYEAGQVPLFNFAQEGWKVVPASRIREQILGKKG